MKTRWITAHPILVLMTLALLGCCIITGVGLTHQRMVPGTPTPGVTQVEPQAAVIATAVGNMGTSQSTIYLRNYSGAILGLPPGGTTTKSGFVARDWHTGYGWCTSMLDQTNGYQTIIHGYLTTGEWGTFPWAGHTYLLYSWDC